MSYDLQVLAKPEIRDALFLAEVAAWLHDWEKCTDEHVNNQARPGTFASKKRVQFAALGVGGHTVNLLGEALAFDQLTNRQNGSSLLVEYLNRCHRAPHIEKE